MIIFFLLLAAVLFYSILAYFVSVPTLNWAFKNLPAVSILKPLYGAEPRLYENLRTFCQQDYAATYQLIFGVAQSDDPAIAVVHQLQKEFPLLDIQLVIDATCEGKNLKICNLMNLSKQAQYDYWVIADSDIAVPRDYLKKIIAPLLDESVGVVTCIYQGYAIKGVLSRLGADFINHWFKPAVCVSNFIGNHRFGFGATLALRRSTMEKIGGFSSLKDEMADDFWLSERVRQQHLKTILSSVIVVTDVVENSFFQLWNREVRWLRIIRSIDFFGFLLMIITVSFPWFLFGLVFAISFSGNCLSLIMIILSLFGLFVKIARLKKEAKNWMAAWAAFIRWPARDFLLLVEWIYALFGKEARWNDEVIPLKDK